MDYVIGFLLLASTCLATEPGESWTSEGFTKRLSDGSIATFEYCKWAECTTRITARVEEAQALVKKVQALVKEFPGYRFDLETLYRHRLVLERDGVKKAVWEKRFFLGSEMVIISPSVLVKDVEIIDGRLYILYSFADGRFNLVVYEQRKDAEPWIRLAYWRQDDRPCCDGEYRLTNDGGRPGVRCFPRYRGSREERWDILWNADGVGTLRKRKEASAEKSTAELR